MLHYNTFGFCDMINSLNQNSNINIVCDDVAHLKENCELRSSLCISKEIGTKVIHFTWYCCK